MDVFHFLKIVQMVTDHATNRKYFGNFEFLLINTLNS